MKTYKRVLIALCGVSTMAVAACGEGYEVVKVRGSVPYTEERTAGPGVSYVRAHLMPAKSIVLPEPVVIQQETVVRDAAPIFEQKVQKK